MNPFPIHFQDNTTILNEICAGNWLMDHSALLNLGLFFKNAPNVQVNANESKDRSDLLLSFYNEDLEPVRPREISEIPEGAIAVINCVGPMMKFGNWWFLGANEIIHQLDFVNKLQNVKAIVLYVDGPGGSVAAIGPFQDFAKRKRKPIVALCDTSLSLHRWIPDAVADMQMADNNVSARFGSVGVVSNWMDATGYYEELGIELHEVYADESEHKNEVVRKIRENKEAGYKLLKERYLNPMAKKFQEAVKAAHPNLVQEEGVLTGRTFGAEDALRLNMIHKIGNMKEAMQAAQALAEVKSYK